MKSVRTAQVGLNDLKNDVIGLYKPTFRDNYELVISKSENGTIDTINITQFGAIQYNYCLSFENYGQLKLFPDNKNMNDMLNNPFEWDVFMKQFN